MCCSVEAASNQLKAVSDAEVEDVTNSVGPISGSRPRRGQDGAVNKLLEGALVNPARKSTL